MTELTEHEKHIMVHALTGSGDGQVYRNYYMLPSSCHGIEDIWHLCELGLMEYTGDSTYSCTRAGAHAVGLRLPRDKRRKNAK